MDIPLEELVLYGDRAVYEDKHFAPQSAALNWPARMSQAVRVANTTCDQDRSQHPSRRRRAPNLIRGASMPCFL